MLSTKLLLAPSITHNFQSVTITKFYLINNCEINGKPTFIFDKLHVFQICNTESAVVDTLWWI